jgi:hypothetical protein
MIARTTQNEDTREMVTDRRQVLLSYASADSLPGGPEADAA